MKSILDKIIEKRDSLYKYMNPKTEPDEHDYIMSNDNHQQALLHGKLDAYDEIIKLFENKSCDHQFEFVPPDGQFKECIKCGEPYE